VLITLLDIASYISNRSDHNLTIRIWIWPGLGLCGI
jgi:hypothetical protein